MTYEEELDMLWNTATSLLDPEAWDRDRDFDYQDARDDAQGTLKPADVSYGDDGSVKVPS